MFPSLGRENRRKTVRYLVTRLTQQCFRSPRPGRCPEHPGIHQPRSLRNFQHVDRRETLIIDANDSKFDALKIGTGKSYERRLEAPVSSRYPIISRAMSSRSSLKCMCLRKRVSSGLELVVFTGGAHHVLGRVRPNDITRANECSIRFLPAFRRK